MLAGTLYHLITIHAEVRKKRKGSKKYEKAPIDDAHDDAPTADAEIKV